MNDILPLAAPSPPAPAAPAVPVVPLTYGRRELALALSISLATLDRLDAGGKVPQAIRIGGRKVWCRETIEEWLRVGAPDRQTWNALQAAQRNGRPR